MPVLVSHCANNRICNAQKALHRDLRKLLSDNIEFYQVSARNKGGKNFKTIEYSEKTRSFLYLSLACMFALELNISKVYLFENGIMAINVPLVQSRIFNTKTAHPTFISKFNRLMSDLFPNTIDIENPFILMTKGEVVQLLDDIGSIIQNTITCSRMAALRWTGQKNVDHCGICLPCILRRVTLDNANLTNYDSTYVDDIFGNYDKIPQQGKTLIFQLLAFGRTLEKDNEDIMNDNFHFYVEEINDSGQLIEMYRRYIDEVKKSLRTRADSFLREMAKQ